MNKTRFALEAEEMSTMITGKAKSRHVTNQHILKDIIKRKTKFEPGPVTSDKGRSQRPWNWFEPAAVASDHHRRLRDDSRRTPPERLPGFIKSGTDLGPSR